MTKFEKADSSIQREIEEYLFDKFKIDNDFDDLAINQIINLDKDAIIKPDIYSKKHKVIGEIHSHLGKLKPAQKHKVASDILKMLLHDDMNGEEFNKYIIVCDKEEYKQLKESGSHISLAIKQFNINVIQYEPPAELKEKLEKTMKEQNYYGKGAANG